MGDDKPLINVSVAGDLGPAADTFVKKVSKGFGGVFAPWQIKRVAKAEAAASLIQAKAEIEITDLQRRAMHRFLEEEARHQQNIEDITAKAIPLLEDAPKSEEMDDDWVTNFFAKSRIVSNAEMQQLWARVLSGEANTPGTYSTRTVNFLAELDKTDCEIFSRLCGFIWMFESATPLVFDLEAEIYRSNHLTFESLIHLESIGLIQFSTLGAFFRNVDMKKGAVFHYGRKLLLTFPQDTGNQLETGTVLLTKTGKELFRICSSEPTEGFWEYVCAHWKQYLPTDEPAQSPP